MKKYHSNDYPGKGFEDKPMTNEEIRAMYMSIYNEWWRPLSMNPVTPEVLDKAYSDGVKRLEAYESRMAFDVFVGLFRQLEMRCNK